MSRFFDLMTAQARSLGVPAANKPHTESAPRLPRQLIKLDANESPYGPSPKAVAAMRAALESSHCYPDDDACDLRSKLAEGHGVQPEQIMVAPGSTGVLTAIARTMLEPGLNTVTSACSFVLYHTTTRAAGGQLIEVPTRDNGFDLEAILAAINDSTRVVLIANPNNPTGTLVDAATLDDFIARVPSHVLVAIDEAYYDYAEHFARARATEYSHSLDHVRRAANVIVLRTFSKAHGLAGVRIGYGIGPVELVSYLTRMQDAFSVSTVAQAGALAALDDEGHVRRAVENNARQAERLVAELAAIGYPVAPTWTNFVCCDVRQDAKLVAEALRAEGMLVRALDGWGAPTSIRVTIGSSEQNQAFLAALRRVTTSR